MGKQTKEHKPGRRFKIGLIILFAVLISTLGAVYYITDNSPRLIIKPPSGVLKPGEEFEVGVVLENNPGVIIFCLFLNYDETRFDFVSVANGPVLDGQILETRSGVFDSSPAVRVTNGLRVEPFTGDGVLYTVTFKVRDEAESSKCIFNLTYREGDIVGEPKQPGNQPNNFAPSTTDGTATVKSNTK